MKVRRAEQPIVLDLVLADRVIHYAIHTLLLLVLCKRRYTIEQKAATHLSHISLMVLYPLRCDTADKRKTRLVLYTLPGAGLSGVATIIDRHHCPEDALNNLLPAREQGR